MRLLTVSGILFTLAVSLSGQHAGTYNPVRPMPAPVNAIPYGNILHPGGIYNNFPNRLGGTVSGSIPYTGVPPGYRAPNGGYGRNRTVVIPYAVPVYGGGYYGGYGGYEQQAPTNVTVVVPQQPTPSVVINQTFNSPDSTNQELRAYTAEDVPERGGLRVYEPNHRSEPIQRSKPVPPRTEQPGTEQPGVDSQAKPQASAQPAIRTYAREDKPTVFLIALKDSTIRQAIGYWVEGTTLQYVTPQASVNHVSLEMVDREMSTQLNAERKLEFELKAK